jgi:hypothetical protein
VAANELELGLKKAVEKDMRKRSKKQNELKNVTQFQSVRKALGMFATKGPSSSAEAFLRLQKVTSRARGLWMPCQAYGS